LESQNSVEVSRLFQHLQESIVHPDEHGDRKAEVNKQK
jgi:hypothetical protein